MITLDDGHPASYDHEAHQSPLLPGEGEDVTLACECGDWSQTGPADCEGEPVASVVDEWVAHVYAATGRTAPVGGEFW